MDIVSFLFSIHPYFLLLKKTLLFPTFILIKIFFSHSSFFLQPVDQYTLKPRTEPSFISSFLCRPIWYTCTKVLIGSAFDMTYNSSQWEWREVLWGIILKLHLNFPWGLWGFTTFQKSKPSCMELGFNPRPNFTFSQIMFSLKRCKHINS